MRRNHDSTDRWGVVEKDGLKFTYPYWMPDFNHIRTGSEPPKTKAEWDKKYAGAVAHIRKCCAKPDAPGCIVEPIPIEPMEN